MAKRYTNELGDRNVSVTRPMTSTPAKALQNTKRSGPFYPAY
jgi:hypothetical protein